MVPSQFLRKTKKNNEFMESKTCYCLIWGRLNGCIMEICKTSCEFKKMVMKMERAGDFNNLYEDMKKIIYF